MRLRLLAYLVLIFLVSMLPILVGIFIIFLLLWLIKSFEDMRLWLLRSISVDMVVGLIFLCGVLSILGFGALLIYVLKRSHLTEGIQVYFKEEKELLKKVRRNEGA